MLQTVFDFNGIMRGIKRFFLKSAFTYIEI